MKRMLKCLSAAMIPIALYPFFTILGGLVWPNMTGRLSDRLSFFAMYSAGYLLSFLLSRFQKTKRSRIFIAVCIYAAILTAAAAVFVLTSRDTSLWFAIFQTAWVFLLLCIAMHFGARTYNDPLKLSFNGFLAASLILSALLNWIFKGEHGNLLLYSILVYAFIVVLLNNQEGIDSRVLAKNRINSIIPSNLRRINVMTIVICFAVILLLLLAKDIAVPIIKAIGSFAGAAIVRFLAWIAALLNNSADGDDIIDEPMENADPMGLESGEGHPIWSIIFGLLMAALLSVILFFLIKAIIKRWKPAIARIVRLIKDILQRLIAFITGGASISADELGLVYIDSIEALTREKRGRKRAKRSDLRRIQDSDSRIRFMYKLQLLRLQRSMEIKPSDTVGDILRKSGSLPENAALRDLTPAYEAVRYGKAEETDSVKTD